MPWWPVQTDIFSLLCGLLALIALDRWLLTTRRAWLLASAISFLAALLFKETALCIPLMVPLLALYRRRAAVIPATALYVGIAAVFYVVRTLAAPEASGPEWAGMKTLNQFAYYSVHALWKNAVTATWAPIFTSLGLVLLVLVMVWRRIEWVWIVFAVPLWFLLGGQLFAGNFAQYTVIGPWERLLPVLLFWSGAAALVLVTDRGVSPALAVAVAASCIPALNRMGPHYWYWLLAFYALLNASLLNRLWEVLAGRNAALLVPLFPARSEAEVEQPTDPMSSDAPAEASGTQPRDAREQEGNTRP